MSHPFRGVDAPDVAAPARPKRFPETGSPPRWQLRARAFSDGSTRLRLRPVRAARRRS
jgi:hypothetical protein